LYQSLKFALKIVSDKLGIRLIAILKQINAFVFDFYILLYQLR